MHRSASLAAIACVVLLPAIAHADWQNTRWGMTEKQVRSAVKNLEMASQEEIDKKKFRDGSVLSLKGKYYSGDLEFRAYFYFDGDVRGLSHVTLEHTTPKQCPAIMGALKSRYGLPDEGKPDPVFSLWTWRTDRDLIHLTQIGQGDRTSLCDIHYQPRAGGRAKGL